MNIQLHEEEKSLLCRIPNKLCSYSSLMEREHKSPFLKCGVYIMTFLQRVQYEGGEKSNLIMEKPDKHDFSQGQHQQSQIMLIALI